MSWTRGILCGPMGKRLEVRAVGDGASSDVVVTELVASLGGKRDGWLRLEIARDAHALVSFPHTPNRERFRGLAGCMIACMVRELITPTTARDARHMHGHGAWRRCVVHTATSGAILGSGGIQQMLQTRRVTVMPVLLVRWCF